MEHTIKLEEKAASDHATVSIRLAADGAGKLYVDEYLGKNEANVTSQAVFEYTEAGQELERFVPPGGDPAEQGT